jgi:hypothetical protein
MAETETGPTDIGTGDAPSTAPDPAAAIKDRALTEMARSEDITSYAQEREARQAEERGEKVDEEARGARIRQALEQARKSTAEVRQQNGLDNQPPNLDTAFEDAERVWQQQQQEEQAFEQERQRAHNQGRFTAHAEQLKQVNPQAWQEINGGIDALSTMVSPAQNEAIANALADGDPREGLAVMHRLTQTSHHDDGSVHMSAADKLAHLASLPPEQLADTIDQCRNYLRLEHDISRKYAARYAQQGRRHTKAPPPFSRPRGGASPPQNLNTLASKSENIDSYVKVRHAQMKAADE